MAFNCSICWEGPLGLLTTLEELIRWLVLMGVSSWASHRDVPRLFRGVSIAS